MSVTSQFKMVSFDMITPLRNHASRSQINPQTFVLKMGHDICYTEHKFIDN